MIEVDYIPHLLSPSVSAYAPRKQRLILELRYVNYCLYEQRITFKVWRSFENYVLSNNFTCKFDFKMQHNHVDTDPEYYTYLGFS